MTLLVLEPEVRQSTRPHYQPWPCCLHHVTCNTLIEQCQSFVLTCIRNLASNSKRAHKHGVGHLTGRGLHYLGAICINLFKQMLKIKFNYMYLISVASLPLGFEGVCAFVCIHVEATANRIWCPCNNGYMGSVLKCHKANRLCWIIQISSNVVVSFSVLKH